MILLFSFLLFLPSINSQNGKFGSINDCIHLRDIFGNSTAAFSQCVVANSRPITICQNCIKHYIHVTDSYENMTKFNVNSTTCLDVFVNQDRLEILNTLYGNTIDLWSRAKCYDCFLVEKGKQTSKISNTLKHFEDLDNTFQECVNNATEEDVCPSCMKDYVTLNNYFTEISNVNEKISYCMDIVDVMNKSWTFWSFKCCKFRKHDEYVFLGLAIAVLGLTVIFYFVLQFCNETKAPLIIRQNRFAESINTLRNEIERLST